MCALYLDPPADTVLFSVDEKTCMQARSRKRASRPVRPGQVGRWEFEYVRHGTVSLIAAMNVTTGAVHPKIIARNDSDTFIEFLTELAQTVDPAKKIHLILDNGSSHTSKQTRKWLQGREPDALVFTAPRGGVLRVRNFRRNVFDPAVRRVGPPGFHPRELRHTAASLAIASGADVKVVQLMLGHKTATLTLDLYGHLFPDKLDELADRTDEAVCAPDVRQDLPDPTGEERP